jgi:hypothetical protein
MRCLTNNDDIKKYIIKIIEDLFINNNKEIIKAKKSKKSKTINYTFDERNVYTIIYI